MNRTILCLFTLTLASFGLFQSKASGRGDQKELPVNQLLVAHSIFFVETAYDLACEKGFRERFEDVNYKELWPTTQPNAR